MKLAFFLLPKYLKLDRTQPFIFVTALLAFLGIGIGVMVLCVAMAIMNGVSKEFREKIMLMNYPLSVKSLKGALVPQDLLYSLQIEFPDLRFSPYVRSHALIKTPYGINPAVIFGVDFAQESEINPILKQTLVDTNAQDLKDFGLVLGREFDEGFGIKPKQKVILFFTELVPHSIGFTPVSKRFEVQGFFHSGIGAYDRAYGYTSLQSLQKVRNIADNLYDGIHIDSAQPLQDYERIAKFLKQRFGYSYYVEGWWHQNGNLFSAMELEKRALFIVLLLIILMASLNIISSLLMVIMNRRKEIALLLSMGASQKEIKKSFFVLGNSIGMAGILFGFVLAFVAMKILDKFPIVSLPANVYGTTKLPLDFSLLDFALIALGSIVIVLFSAYYPANRASKINLLEVLRNE
ncbi:hypothetical protein BBW65_03235 [Helicobacter enhydrae]|uniref:ABC transporter permease n=1 Tax=Helicobacter enhydrae TaxID=222136 RepID=A0A1B1U540_9HELI|nr:ABC transporter permease [Helicobacter enhydrae]ANV97876.1 hypothetical protein BBW65_03235 [Helicobacter enhydrae]